MLKNKIMEAEDKLRKACLIGGLRYTFYAGGYPLMIELSHAEEEPDQVKMPIVNKEIDPYMKIKLIFKDGIKIQTEGDITIDDDVLSKIKRCAKNLHYLYLQFYHQEAMFKKIGYTNAETGEIIEKETENNTK